MDTRVGTRLDVYRLGRALAHPGIDPRSWCTLGRVENDPDARLWDPALGWVVDVECYGGDTDGETDVVCRVLTPVGNPDAGVFRPPELGAEVCVVLPSGDPEAAPVVIGYVRNENEDAQNKAPTEINGLPIDGELETSTPLTVSPFDTVIVVSPDNLREQYVGTITRQGAQIVLRGDNAIDAVLLGSPDASQSVVLGDDYTSAISAVVDGLLEQLAAIPPTGGPPPGLAAFQVQWVTQLQPALEAALSARVKAE